MQVIKFILLKLYMVWVLIVFSVFMLIYLPFILGPFFFGEKAGVISCLFLKIWSKTFSILNAIRYEVVGSEHIKPHKAYIYVSNHTSYLDLPGISLALPTQYRPLAKKELKKIPVFGWIAQRVCVIIDRSSKQSKKESIENLKRILNLGISILLFPEGTQNRTNSILQPFYSGAFRIAVETGAPIIPIVLLNAGKLMPPTRVHIEPGRIKVVIGREICVNQLKLGDEEELKERVYGIMKKIIVENSPYPPPRR